MLEGLEISILNNHELERTLRIDSEFYSKENLQIDKKLKALHANRLTEYAIISDGNHMSISDSFTEKGIPYYRGGDIYNMFIEQCPDPLYIPRSIFNMKTMQRSHLKKGDILMSIVGAIIGNLSLVSTTNDATCSCKLAIIRPFANLTSEYVMTFLKSEVGQSQIQRYRRGSGQTGFILEDFDQLLIPELNDKINDFVKDCFNRAKQSYVLSIEKYNNAITLLHEQLNLQNMHLSTSNIKIQNYNNSFLNSGRLDAEYYQAKYDDLETLIKNYNHDTLENLCLLINHGMQPPYVEDGGMRVFSQKWIKESEIDYSFIEDNNEPRTSMEFALNNPEYVCRRNDIVYYSVGANIGFCHTYLSDVPMMPGSFITLIRANEEKINPIYLGVVLNSIVGRLQSEKRKSGTAQPYIYPKDLKEFLIPILPLHIQKSIAHKQHESFVLKADSKRLLEVAKKAVEIAISENEEKALKYINEINL